MIKFGFNCYALVSILAPWIFLAAKLANLINYPGNNSTVFGLLFIYSGMWLVFLFWAFKEDTCQRR